MQHHVDRFHSALLVLAGDGHIKQRLIAAFEKNIDTISEDEFPLELKDTLIDLKAELKRVEPQNGEGAICATVRKMSVDEASRCAEKVLSLYTHLLGIRDVMRDGLPLGEGEAMNQPVLVKTVGSVA